MVFEGDDSILATSPKIEEKDALYVCILQRWERLGFNMEIKMNDPTALFTGYRFSASEMGVGDEFCPEIDRCFGRAGVSCSPGVAQAWKQGDVKEVKSTSMNAALSRAYEFAGLVPTISNKYLNYYLGLREELGKLKVDRELSMRTTGCLDFDESEVVSTIRMRNDGLLNSDIDEKYVLAATGYGATTDEIDTFQMYQWDFSTLGDWEGFKASLPAKWK